MKKKNKKEKSKQVDKNEEKVEMENYWDVFLRNYRNVPGFKSLVKLLIWLFLIFIFIIIASSANNDINYSSSEDKATPTTMTTTKTAISYQELLDDILQNEKKISISITDGEDKYMIDADMNLGVMSRYYTTKTTTKRFSIEENKIYELNLDERIENNELFGKVNNNFINQHSLVKLIETTVGTKEVKNGEIVYNYAVNDNGINYSLQSFIKDDILYKIEIKGEDISYTISYK